MWNILSFNTFITQNILIFIYYIGAVIFPVMIYLFRNYLITNISWFKTLYKKIEKFYISFPTSKKRVFWIVFWIIFVCAELFWRMMFETMIGYFDMHDYLHMISQHIQNFNFSGGALGR